MHEVKIALFDNRQGKKPKYILENNFGLIDLLWLIKMHEILMDTKNKVERNALNLYL